jgi:hypothetical protein
VRLSEDWLAPFSDDFAQCAGPVDSSARHQLPSNVGLGRPHQPRAVAVDFDPAWTYCAQQFTAEAISPIWGNNGQ